MPASHGILRLRCARLSVSAPLRMTSRSEVFQQAANSRAIYFDNVNGIVSLAPSRSFQTLMNTNMNAQSEKQFRQWQTGGCRTRIAASRGFALLSFALLPLRCIAADGADRAAPAAPLAGRSLDSETDNYLEDWIYDLGGDSLYVMHLRNGHTESVEHVRR